MARNIFLVILILVFLLLAVTFTWLNPGDVALDLAFVALEPPKAVAFITTFALGWIFGILSISSALLRVMRERRRLRKSLQLAEREVDNLRILPGQDAA